MPFLCNYYNMYLSILDSELEINDMFCSVRYRTLRIF